MQDNPEISAYKSSRAHTLEASQLSASELCYMKGPKINDVLNWNAGDANPRNSYNQSLVGLYTILKWAMVSRLVDVEGQSLSFLCLIRILHY